MVSFPSVPHCEAEVLSGDRQAPKRASNDNRRCHMYAIIATGGKQYKVAEGEITAS